MIKFALRCGNGHNFESWFQSGDIFEAQAASGLVSCPICGSVTVVKDIMAPSLARRVRSDAPRETAPPPAPEPAVPQICADAKTRAMIVELRNRILENSDDLGPDFPEEALKIHHGVAPDRPIHGQASAEEARALLEEGVKIMPIPGLPGDLN